MITKNKTIYMLSFISITLATFSSLSFASDKNQQIAAVSQEIQVLQEKLYAASNKIEQLCNCTINKDSHNQIDVSKIHQTANGRH